MSSELHPTSGYTRAEEWANSITHGIGIGLSIAGLVVAVVLASLKADAYLITASAIYGASLLVLHFSSMLQYGLSFLPELLPNQELSHRVEDQEP